MGKVCATKHVEKHINRRFKCRNQHSVYDESEEAIFSWSQYFLDRVIEVFSLGHKAQHLLFPTIYELEPRVIDILRTKFSFPVYTLQYHNSSLKTCYLKNSEQQHRLLQIVK